MRFFFFSATTVKKMPPFPIAAGVPGFGLSWPRTPPAAELNLEHPTCMGCSSSSSKSGATPPDVNAYGEDMDASMHEYDMARRTESSACTSALART